MRTTGQRIKERLSEVGWTQQDLAERSGVDKGALSRFISGKLVDMSIHRLAAIAKALDVSLAWLYDESGPKTFTGATWRGEPELSAFDWPPEAPEVIRIAIQQEVLAEREAHRQALVPYWLGRMRSLLEQRRG